MLSDDHLFSKIGIDSVGFHAPRHFVKLEELALERKVDPAKYAKGLLSKEMRVPDVDEDIVSLGLKAGYNALRRGGISPKSIDGLFVGTETEVYAAKSISNIFGEMLGISPNSMTQDIYNACAGGTLAIINAIALVERGMCNRALVICADLIGSSLILGSFMAGKSNCLIECLCADEMAAGKTRPHRTGQYVVSRCKCKR